VWPGTVADYRSITAATDGSEFDSIDANVTDDRPALPAKGRRGA
jgi:hypothetical protein